MAKPIVSKVRERGNELNIVFEIVFENGFIGVSGLGPGQPAGVSKTIVCENKYNLANYGRLTEVT